MAAGMPAAADRQGVAAVQAEVAHEQLALASLAALVLLGERGRIAEPVEQVVGRVGFAHAGPAAVVAVSRDDRACGRCT